MADTPKSIWLYLLVLSVLAAAAIVWATGGSPQKLQLAVGYTLLVFLFAIAMTVVVLMAIGTIDLSAVMEEMNGGASMSRFQLLIFTFVIAFGFFYLTVNNPAGGFPTVSGDVLTLLGLSASTYAVGKGIQVSSGETTTDNTSGNADTKSSAAAAGSSQGGTSGH